MPGKKLMVENSIRKVSRITAHIRSFARPQLIYQRKMMGAWSGRCGESTAETDNAEQECQRRRRVLKETNSNKLVQSIEILDEKPASQILRVLTYMF